MKLTKEIINEKVEQLRKELLDMVEPKFEVGKWYKDKLGLALIYNSGNYKDNYGLKNDGVWGDYYVLEERDNQSFIEATPSEVQAALEAEAVKRGFKERVKIKSIHGDYEFILINSLFSFRQNSLYFGGYLIFEDGKWSQIIPQEKTSEEWVEAFNNRPKSTLNKFLKDNNLKITKK